MNAPSNTEQRIGKEWAHERRRFNHNWLNNRFLIPLACVQRLSADEFQSDELAQEFMTCILPQWDEGSEYARRLIGRFEGEMSPKTLFMSPPLMHCDDGTKVWLPELCHEIWQRRLSVAELIGDALNALDDADAAYRELRRLLDVRSECVSMTCGGENLPRVTQKYFESCTRLADIIARFPDRIEFA